MMAAILTSEATAALIGAGGGWVLGFFTDYGREELRAQRSRRVAALLIFGELTSNLAAVAALRKYGVWSTERIHRTAWESHAAACMHRADIGRVGHLMQAYNALEDVGFLVSSEENRDFTKGEDARFLDSVLIPLVFDGMRDVGVLAGVPPEQVEARLLESRRAMRDPPREEDLADV